MVVCITYSTNTQYHAGQQRAFDSLITVYLLSLCSTTAFVSDHSARDVPLPVELSLHPPLLAASDHDTILAD